MTADPKLLIDQAWIELLKTTKPGTWAAANPAAPGHWQNARRLLTEAQARAGTRIVTIESDGKNPPTLRAVLSAMW